MAGLDLGKQQDPSVLCITEAIEYYLGLFTIGEKPSYIDDFGVYHPSEPKLEQRFQTIYTVRHIEPMPLETPYFQVAERVADVLAGLPQYHQSYNLFIDATGVGNGVVEIVQDTFGKRADVRHIKLKPVTITYGRQEYSTHTASVSKHALISRLLKLMGAEVPALQVPSDLQGLIPLLSELRTFQEKVNAENGNTTYNGKPGTHDDMVIALALSVLVDPRKYKVTYSKRIY